MRGGVRGAGAALCDHERRDLVVAATDASSPTISSAPVRPSSASLGAGHVVRTRLKRVVGPAIPEDLPRVSPKEVRPSLRALRSHLYPCGRLRTPLAGFRIIDGLVRTASAARPAALAAFGPSRASISSHSKS